MKKYEAIGDFALDMCITFCGAGTGRWMNRVLVAGGNFLPKGKHYRRYFEFPQMLSILIKLIFIETLGNKKSLKGTS